MMQTVQASLLTRDDTFFGVCEAIGEDFGFNANWLRAALAVALFWNPVVIAAVYVALGVVVILTRWLFPTPRSDRSDDAIQAEPEADIEMQPELAAAA